MTDLKATCELTYTEYTYRVHFLEALTEYQVYRYISEKYTLPSRLILDVYPDDNHSSDMATTSTTWVIRTKAPLEE